MNRSRAFRVVEMFEEAVAEYTGAPYVVAVNSCSAALHLCCIWWHGGEISIPQRTYPSVLHGALNAGLRVTFRDEQWSGAYQLAPTPIWDCAKRFTRDMYVPGQVQCVSFHPRKLLPVGQGGAVLSDDLDLTLWLRRMRFDGRRENVPTAEDKFDMAGYHYYMSPETAARGLWLLEYYPKDVPDQPVDNYPDLSKSPLAQHQGDPK